MFVRERHRSSRSSHGGLATIVTILAGAGVVGLASTRSIPAQENPDRPTLEVAAHLGGATNQVLLRGSLAYVAIGPRVVIYDVSQPASPRRTGATEVLPEVVRGMALDGSRLVLGLDGSYRRWLAVLDVADPAEPEVRSLMEVDEVARGIVAARGYAYLLTEMGGLQVVDLTDPAVIRLGAQVPLEVDVDDSLALAGDTLFAATRSSGLVAFSLDDPAKPRRVGAFRRAGGGQDVAIDGDIGYLLTQDVHLLVIDVQDPAAMRMLASLPLNAGSAYDIAVSRTFVQVAHMYGVTILDASDPARPRVVGDAAVPELWYDFDLDLAAQGGFAFVASAFKGLYVVDFHDPARPEVIAVERPPAIVEDVAVDGDTAFVASGLGGLWAVDIRDPAQPRVVDVVDIFAAEPEDEWTSLECVAAGGGFAYALDTWSDILFIVRQRGDGTLEVVSELPIPGPSPGGPAKNIAYAGGRVYVPNGERLWIADVQEQAAPRILGSAAVAGAGSVVVREGVAFVGTDAAPQNSSIQAVDVRDPARPLVIGRFDLIGYYTPGLALDGARLLAAHNSLRVIDVADPSAPRQVGEAAGRSSAVAAAEGYGFLDFYDSDGPGIRLYDVQDPSAPAPLADAPLSDPSTGGGGRLAARGAFAFSARGEAGLFVLRRVHGAPAPPRRVFLPWAWATGGG